MNPRVGRLLERGVKIIDPAQVFIGEEVLDERIEAGAVLHPGARLLGAKTLIMRGAEIGAEGPATIQDCALGRSVRLASGSFEGAVFFEGASYGPMAHVRAGTLLEEGASAAHATGTKQTILLPFATLGSNVNFCDALLSGGRSAKDHSEVGSGFIHFNFTPFGPTGDKATASLFGDVPRGVFLREDRIFLGGAGGVVGPIQIGFGTVLAAGSVYRKDRGEGRLVYAESLPDREVGFEALPLRRVRARLLKNLAYIGQIEALRAFHLAVRLPLAAPDPLQSALVQEAIDLLEGARLERKKQLARYLEGLQPSIDHLQASGHGEGAEASDQRALLRAKDALLERLAEGPEPAVIEATVEAFRPELRGSTVKALEFVRSLSPDAVARGTQALNRVVSAVMEANPLSRV